MEMSKLTVTQLPDRLVRTGKEPFSVFGIKKKCRLMQLIRSNCLRGICKDTEMYPFISSFSSRHRMKVFNLHMFSSARQWCTYLAKQTGNAFLHLRLNVTREGPAPAVASKLTAFDSPPPRLDLITINSPNQNLCLDIHSHFRPPVMWTLTQK